MAAYIPSPHSQTWRWDIEAYLKTITGGGGGSGAAATSISDTPPPGPTPGQLWFESDTGNTFIWYADADSSQWVQVNVLGSTPAGVAYQVKTADAYNRVVNGAMQHSQENGNTAGTTTVYYAADQWAAIFSGISLTAIQRNSITLGDAANVKMTNTAKGSLATGDYWTLWQGLEGNRTADFGWGTPQAKQVVLRFEAYASVLAGPYSIVIRNATHCYVATYALPATQWTTVSMVIPSMASGTWLTDTSRSMELYFTFAAGSTNVAPTAGWQAGGYLAAPGTVNGAASAQSVYIRNVGLYLDPNNTGLPPPWVTPDFMQELRTCMRYWQMTMSCLDLPATNGVAYSSLALLAEPMRTNPNLSSTDAGTAGFGTASLSLQPIGNVRHAVFDTRTANTTGRAYARAFITATARM